jgi:hypothetical protein
MWDYSFQGFYVLYYTGCRGCFDLVSSAVDGRGSVVQVEEHTSRENDAADPR